MNDISNTEILTLEDLQQLCYIRPNKKKGVLL